VERNGIEYDPETNLPKLREGLFWKIRRIEGASALSLSIVEQAEFYKYTFLWLNWGSYTEYRTFEGLYTHISSNLSDDRIKTEAEKLYTQLVEMESIEDWLTEREGIYPPKKL
jgi:hypothetical protein